MRLRNNIEHRFQKAAIQWLTLALVPPAFASSIDHAGGGRIAGALRKARGVKPGLADVFIFSPQAVVCLELKAPKGRLSDEQMAMAAKLRACGIWTYTCYTLDDIEKACVMRGIPLRASLEPRAAAQARLT